MTTSIIYTGDLHTRATHIRSGDVMSTDAPLDNNGKGEAFAPTDLIAVSLGTCILTVMGIAARNHAIDMNDAVAEVTKTMGANPRRITRLEVRIIMPPKEYSKKEKAILEKSAHHCPVKNSLHPDLEEVIEFVWEKSVSGDR